MFIHHAINNVLFWHSWDVQGSTPLDAWSRLIIMIFYGFVKIRITRAKKAKIEEEHYHEQSRNKK
ncbi:hypothetical protein KVMX100_140043 [Klebsiella variicola]|nr:hypothetical protein KVMX100_140043 [Klebsiella variicola]